MGDRRALLAIKRLLQALHDLKVYVRPGYAGFVRPTAPNCTPTVKETQLKEKHALFQD
jgi:hypothetical protein